jgi:hypothetical protein
MYLPRAIGFLFAATVLLLHIWGGFILGHDLFYPQFLARGLFVSFIGGIAGYGLGNNILSEYFKYLEKQFSLNAGDMEPFNEEMRELDLNQSNFTQAANSENLNQGLETVKIV